ncbi:MAG TPA: hypothetical protein VG873_13915 [Burkholderiales bacterium]|nr:hypothetical protein [Burkholderiales bacterium]
MKRTLIATALVLVSGSAFANEGFPQPSFNDGSNVAAQVVTSQRTVDNQFPKAGTPMGGPTGPATVLLQSIADEKVYSATIVEPSFNG